MTKKRIAIIGLGIAGLHLAYGLKEEFEVTIFHNKNADFIRNNRIPSTQVHFEKLLSREERYAIPDYGQVNELKKIEILLNGQKMFKGNLEGRAISLDQRIYLPTLMDGLQDSSVSIVEKRISREELPQLAKEFDLIIDCTGKLGPLASFPKCEELKMPTTPLRVCSAAFFNGITPDEENKLAFNIVPGQGELFEMSMVTQKGLARSLLIEAIPGSEMDLIKGDKGPEEFTKSVKQVLEKFFPEIYKRVDENAFELVDPNAYMRIAIKPEISIPYTTINETLVLGCGDSFVLNDPITGQGANTSSYCAEMLIDTLAVFKDSAWDTALGEAYWLSVKEYAIRVTEWTNAMMGPLSEPFTQMLGEATQSQEVADRFVNMFHNPLEAHGVFFSKEEESLVKA